MESVHVVVGWIRPNDQVDVLCTFEDPSSGDLMTVTSLQSIRVLATGNITGTTNPNLLSDSERSYDSVSFLVLPEEAERLTPAAELGTSTLVLRNPKDTDLPDEMGPTTLETLLATERAQALETRRLETILLRRSSGTAEPTKPTKNEAEGDE